MFSSIYPSVHAFMFSADRSKFPLRVEHFQVWANICCYNAPAYCFRCLGLSDGTLQPCIRHDFKERVRLRITS